MIPMIESKTAKNLTGYRYVDNCSVMELPEQSKFYREIAENLHTPVEVWERAKDDPEFLKIILDGWKYGDGNVRAGCEKILKWISQFEPQTLYDRFEYFCGFLNSPNQILQSAAAAILANLTLVDENDLFQKNIDLYYSQIKGPNMTIAVNLVKSSTVVAENKPNYVGDIIQRCMLVEEGKFQNEDSREIVIGQIVDFIGANSGVNAGIIKKRDEIISWLHRQEKSKRIATRKKVRATLEKLEAK